MSDQPVHLTAGIPETVLPSPVDDVTDRVERARALPPDERRAALAEVAADHPRVSLCWAELGDVGRDDVERYAMYRVGYHRGLDALRANGWRGSGYVRWSAPSNRGFLRSLLGLREMAERIGEDDEVERCATFLAQLDPSGVPDDPR